MTNQVVIHEGPKAHFPWHQFAPGGKYVEHDPALAIHNPATYHAWAIQGPANYYRHTGYEPAIELAGKLSRWVMEDSNHFAPDGRFLEEYPGVTRVHFHGHTMTLLSLLDYGLAADDPEAVEFSLRGFRYALSQGEIRLGYFAEWLNVPGIATLELCEVGDMIALAVKLSRACVADYWDMADRWVRNLFYEGQFRDVDRIKWFSEKLPASKIPDYATDERALERNVGAFGGALMPNDFYYGNSWDGAGIVHCCTGNCARAIYYVWENILNFEDDRLKINLLLNRASEWADVESHIPYRGQVDVKVKKPLALSVRIPEWVQPEETRCTVNDKARNLDWDGRYAKVGNVKERDVVTFAFPIRERTETINVQKRPYRILLRGNTCVAIDPPGEISPLFQREYLRSDATRWKKKEHFVSGRTIDW